MRLEKNRKEAIIALEREREVIEMKCMYKEDHRVMILLLSRRGSSTKALKLDTAIAGGGAGVKESVVVVTDGGDTFLYDIQYTLLIINIIQHLYSI